MGCDSQKLLKGMGFDTTIYDAMTSLESEQKISQLSNDDKVLFNNIETIVNEWNFEKQWLTYMKDDVIISRQYEKEMCAIFLIIKQGGTTAHVQKYIEWWVQDAIDIYETLPDFQTIMDEGKEYIEKLYTLTGVGAGMRYS
jgi:hypothetical protein